MFEVGSAGRRALEPTNDDVEGNARDPHRTDADQEGRAVHGISFDDEVVQSARINEMED